MKIKHLEDYVEEACLDDAEVEVFETLETNESVNLVYEYGCSVGIGGFTYYCETEQFFSNHSTYILSRLQEAKETELIGDIEFSANSFVWTFVELVIMDYVNWLQCQDFED